MDGERGFVLSVAHFRLLYPGIEPRDGAEAILASSEGKKVRARLRLLPRKRVALETLAAAPDER